MSEPVVAPVAVAVTPTPVAVVPAKSPIQMLQEQANNIRVEMARAELPKIKEIRVFLDGPEMKNIEEILHEYVSQVGEDTAASGLVGLLGALTHCRNQMLHRESVHEQVIQLAPTS